MAKPDLKIVELYPNNFRDAVAALRKIADEIEAGDFGNVGSVGVVIMGNKMEIFGAGVDSEGPTMALLFQAASLRFAKMIESHGDD